MYFSLYALYASESRKCKSAVAAKTVIQPWAQTMDTAMLMVTTPSNF